MNVVSFPSRLRIVEWQTLAAERVAGLYAEETDRWQRLLDWDTSRRWEAIEGRRRQGAASGWAVLDETGVVRGWCHFNIRDRVLRIEAFNAEDETASQLMLDRLLSAPALAYVERVSMFVLCDVDGLTQALRARGLSLDRYWYLGRELNPVSPPSLQGIRSWRLEDVQATAALFGRAYEKTVETRPFAPLGTPEQWSAYAGELFRGASGALLPEACLCLPAGPDKLSAVAIVTRIGENTAHLAQLVVDPALRRRRVGQQLMDLASAAAARQGCRRMTLIVGGANRPARAMFDAARYRTMGSLVAAGTLQPRRGSGTVASGLGGMRR